MLRIVIIFFILGTCTPSFSQYSQSIDSLSKKEIKELIMQLDDSNQAKIHMNKFKKRKALGITLMSVGAALVISSLSSPQASDDRSYPNLEGIFRGIVGGVSSLSGLIVFSSSSNQFDKSKRSYLSNSTEALNINFKVPKYSTPH